MKINISGKTNLYCVIGDPISHSLSPMIHNHFFRKKGMDSLYIPLRVTTDKLSHGLELLKNNFEGFNVTIPHKETIIPYLDEVDENALQYGAVNTVKVVDGKLCGYNTDGIGFLKSLEQMNISLDGKRVLLLGAGGAARVVALEILRKGGELTIANRNIHRVQLLKEELGRICRNSLPIAKPEELKGPFDIIINSTPVGMHPNIKECPVPQEALHGSQLIYDMIYNPYQTKLLQLGNQLGIKVINGLPMLLYQGLKSLEIWTGSTASPDEEREIYEDLRTYFLNS
ncbi:shikimate dehydrogenase [Anaerosolibacter sp.]|uniref:shikimate dehydrogenase n=1 Tax=Anaerosolibacter sp. TaxID=1872527 RepID=UPI0039EE43EF